MTANVGVQLDAIETTAVRRITTRLIPFLMACYFVAFLDRVNVGFAALQMNKDLGFSSTVYGWGAGIFFLAYFVFEVPSNLLMERVGARLWIARIMISWGLVSAGMAMVHGAGSFYLVRLLLGVAEAGFFPGVILYLTYWFPREHRARIVGLFMLAIPISNFLGSPVSAALLGVDGVLGLRGWQWLFLLEAVPAVALGVATLFLLPDGPAKAAWLPAAERDWLRTRLAEETAASGRHARMPVWEVLKHPRVLLLALAYAGSTATNYGLTYFQPLMIKSFGLSTMQTGLLNAIPFGLGAVAMVLWGRRSDRKRERVWHTSLPLALSALGLLACVVFTTLTPTIIALCVTLIGCYALKGPFWALSTEWLPASSAAAAIAQINALGNLAGFVGPFLLGWLTDLTGSYALGLLPMVALAAIAAVAVQLAGRRGAAETGARAEERAAAVRG
ncbi:MAG TPA: MFS transporter [Rhodopila sp.]|jgi:ACS family tartrate transporter-like MFS transporter|nr:MFS transporter [Rhodopila sp.]